MEYNLSHGPESPVDPLGSQGAKNPRRKEQRGTSYGETTTKQLYLSQSEEMERPLGSYINQTSMYRGTKNEPISKRTEEDCSLYNVSSLQKRMGQLTGAQRRKRRKLKPAEPWSENPRTKVKRTEYIFHPSKLDTDEKNLGTLEDEISNKEQFEEYNLPETEMSRRRRNRQNKLRKDSVMPKVTPSQVRIERCINLIKNNNELCSVIVKNPFEVVLLRKGKFLYPRKLQFEYYDTLCNRIMSMDMTYVPKFEDCRFCNEAIVMTCADERTFSWLKNLDEPFLFRTGTLISGCKLSERTIVKCQFPKPPGFGVGEILQLLKKQNNKLYVSEWNVLHVLSLDDDNDERVMMTLKIDAFSLETIASLNMRPYYGLSRVHFEIIPICE